MSLATSVAIAVAVALATGLLARAARRRHQARSHGCQPPARYPHREPLLGLDAFVQTGRMFVEHTYFATTLARFASIARTFDMNFLGRRVIHSIEARNVHAVFAARAADWGVGPHRLPPMEPYFGRGFVTTDGPEWHRSRQRFVRGFHKTNVRDFATFDRYLTAMIKQIPRDGSTVDMQELNFALYLDTSTLFLFGESFDSLSGGLTPEAKGFLESLRTSFTGCGLRQALGPLRFLYPTSGWRAANAKNHAFVQRYADKALADRRTANDGDGDGADAGRSKQLMESMAEDVHDRIQLRNEAINAFAAANETTACLVSNVIWVLARRPDVWTRLRDEVAALGDVEPDFDKPMKIRYLQNVLNEALRLYPVFPFNIREALTDGILPTGGGRDGKSPIYVRAGDRFEASLVAMHRDESIWGPDANEFRPERWDVIKPAAGQYIPFGIGPKVCVGKQKALMEASFYVFRMLREFKAIEARDEHEWRGEVSVSAKNLYGVQVALTPA